ncbi:hypothetical protein KEM52_001605 [Ascosphaera acerosa]|nr:hypothetical protein KEM52_001605 [Ascosphaera acerosa]
MGLFCQMRWARWQAGWPGNGGGSGSGGSLEQQVAALRLDVPLRYILIASHTDSYMRASAALCAPFGKVCSIVQGRAEMLGTEFMAKSLSFVWCYAGTRAFYGGNVESHGCVLAELAELVDRGIIKSNATETLPFTLEGLKMAHSTSETGKMIGKMALTKIDDELVHYDRKGSVG